MVTKRKINTTSEYDNLKRPSRKKDKAMSTVVNDVPQDTNICILFFVTKVRCLKGYKTPINLSTVMAVNTQIEMLGGNTDARSNKRFWMQFPEPVVSVKQR